MGCRMLIPYQHVYGINVSLRLISGHHDEALAVAERGRTRAFADLLVERQTGQQDSDPYTPVTVEHILDTVNGQRALVLYYSVAAGYLYSWLLAPGSGRRTRRSCTDLWTYRPVLFWWWAVLRDWCAVQLVFAFGEGSFFLSRKSSVW